MTKKLLNILNFSCQGKNLIEASAGTGKTFNIVILYIRIILGIGKKKAYFKKLPINKILVVTFTNDAKKELQNRIINNMQNLLTDCQKRTINHLISKILLPEIKNFQSAESILKKSIHNFNKNYEKSICTIHSFYKNILSKNYSYTNFFKKKNIIKNEEYIYKQSTIDFWRKNVYSLPIQIAKKIVKQWKTPHVLFKKIFLWLKEKENIVNFPKNKTNLKKFHKKLISYIKYLKKRWIQEKDKILHAISIFPLNKKIYNKKNLLRWKKNITKWALKKTKNYKYPLQLKYFNLVKKYNSYTNLLKKIYFFQELKNFLSKNFSITEKFLKNAIISIPRILKKKKIEKKKISFQDLQSLLLESIKKKKNHIKKYIIKKYPITIIDEFQDVDFTQYKIFNFLYKNKKKTSLILIGDPKQSIYNFRGANIFTYLKIQSTTKNFYFLKKNWRSSPNIIKGINYLFKMKNPFIFPQLQYTVIQPEKKNSLLNFFINKKKQHAIHCFVNYKKNICKYEFQKWIAKICASEISYWLYYGKKKKSYFFLKEKKKYIKKKNIAILVKNKYEAQIIKNSLNSLNIPSIYFSQKTNVYKTETSSDLIKILESIYNPSNIQKFRTAISCLLIDQSYYKLKKIIKNKKLTISIMEKFSFYKKKWKKFGILFLINQIIQDFYVKKSFYCDKKKKKKILDLLSIAQKLQKKELKLQKYYKVIDYLKEKKKKDDQYSSSANLELKKKKKNYIKIITIYCSKGLEYPIIWIPFMSIPNNYQTGIFHNKKTHKPIINFLNKKTFLKAEKKEKLSEELRLLYVALTRSIVHISLGVAPISSKRQKTIPIYTNLHESPLGYLLQKGKKKSYCGFIKTIQKIERDKKIKILSSHPIFFKFPTKNFSFLPPKKETLNRNFKKKDFFYTSYSDLTKKKKSFQKHENYSTKKKKYNPYNFPKGKKYGLFLHEILKKVNFKKNIKKSFIKKISSHLELKKTWIKNIKKWIFNILNTTFGKKKIKLSKITSNSYVKEMEFYISCKSNSYNELNTLLKNKKKNKTKHINNFKLHKNKKIIIGYIDLFFFWKGKYYIIDYKSDYLGPNSRFYSEEKIKNIILEKYTIQRKIYEIAIYRYLKYKNKKRKIKKYFGGTFFLFIRSMKKNRTNSGVFFISPNYQKLKTLEKKI